jgi:hypothetical protein
MQRSHHARAANPRSVSPRAVCSSASCLIQHELYRGVEHETAELTGYGQREITVALLATVIEYSVHSEHLGELGWR